MHGDLLTNHAQVLCEGRPLIDLRSPSEFARGAFPGAVNLPLLTDDERAAVGTCFKEKGQTAAIELGERLVAGTTRAARMATWLEFAGTHPGAAIYCWRGGLRSQTVQRWLLQEGVALPRVAGGYKALRTACIAAIEQAAGRPLLILGGRTGSGKTVLLQRFRAAVDLEAAANHRGSAFGGSLDAQPTSIAFENSLAIDLMHRTGYPRLLLEDESRTIGRLAVPESLHRAMQRAPLVVVEVPRSERARQIAQEYVFQPLADGTPSDVLAARLLAATDRIRKRLGGDRHAALRDLIEVAFAAGDAAAHLTWIAQLLEWYYDPMYDHQLKPKTDRIVARGAPDELVPRIDRLLKADEHSG